MSKLTANQEHWQSIIEDWRQSGLTQSQYCRQHNIKVAHFYSWKNQLKKKLERPKTEDAGTFLPVTMESSEPGCASPLLIRVCGVEIEVNHQTDPALLQKTLRLLGGFA